MRPEHKKNTTPEPEFVVICSPSDDWKSLAEIVAKHRQPFLLLGACDPDFVTELIRKHNLATAPGGSEEKILLWPATDQTSA